MAYVCGKHGALSSEWCAECCEIVECDCSGQTYTRFKDLIIDTESGEKTVTIRVYHCETCGEVSHAET
jgi:hypothetical protein